MELLGKEEYAGVTKYLAIAGAATIGTVAAITLLNKRYARSVGRNSLAIITGCDSGLGYAFANYCHERLGMTVVAFVHDEDSVGAKNLRESHPDCESFYVHKLDVVRVDLSDAAFKFVVDLLEKNPTLRKLSKETLFSINFHDNFLVHQVSTHLLIIVELWFLVNLNG